jgi:hypothetical protein
MIVTTKHAWYKNPEGMTRPYHPLRGSKHPYLEFYNKVTPTGWEQEQPGSRIIQLSTKTKFVTVPDMVKTQEYAHGKTNSTYSGHR